MLTFMALGIFFGTTVAAVDEATWVRGDRVAADEEVELEFWL